MAQKMSKQWLWAIPLSIAAITMAGCQEKPAPQQEKATEAKAQAVQLIQAKVIRVDLPKKQFCDEGGCTQYDLQTIHF